MLESLSGQPYATRLRSGQLEEPDTSLPDSSVACSRQSEAVNLAYDNQAAASIKIQAAFRGWVARRTIEHSIKFTTWKNTSKPTQCEHMTIKFGRGREKEYMDFRQGSAPCNDSEPVEAFNVLTKKTESKKYWKLAYGVHTPEEHKARFLARPALSREIQQGQNFRYDAKETVRAEINSMEWLKLKRIIRERKKKGIFHLYSEAPNPMTTRCLTLIEALAKLRGQELEDANVSQIARQFHEMNLSTTTKPILKRFLIGPRERSDNVPDANLKFFDGELDRGYWEAHKKGDHDIQSSSLVGLTQTGTRSVGNDSIPMARDTVVKE